MANLINTKIQSKLRSESTGSLSDDVVNKLANKLTQMSHALLLLHQKDVEKEKRLAYLETEILKKQSIEKFKNKTEKIKQLIKDSKNEIRSELETKIF